MSRNDHVGARALKRSLAITAATALAVTGAAFGSAATANAAPTAPSTVTAPTDLTGWNVVSDPSVYDFSGGDDFLRMSNSVTDQNAYNALSQLNTPSVAAAGEPGDTDATENTFTEQFTVSAADYGLQPGLAIEVSGDNGSGNRNGGDLLLREDDAGQLTVTNFYNDGSTDAIEGWHNKTVEVPFDGPVAIKVVDHFNKGDNNDLVSVYANGDLLFNSTTWENFTDQEDAKKETINSILFRDGFRKAVPGGAWDDAKPTEQENSDLKGNGFQFNDISLTSSNDVTLPATTTKSIELSNIGTETSAGYPDSDVFVGAPAHAGQTPGFSGVTGTSINLKANTQLLHAYPADARPSDLTALIDSGLSVSQTGDDTAGAFLQIPLTYGSNPAKDGNPPFFTTLRPASTDSTTAQYDQQWISSNGAFTGTLGDIVNQIEAAGNVSIFGYGVFANGDTTVNSFQAGTTKYTFADSKAITIATPTITGATGTEGTPRVGDVLTANYTVTSPQSTADQTATYQWYAGTSKIPASSHGTGATYTVPSARVGKQLSVRVTVSKTGELSGVGTSALTPKVVAGVFTGVELTVAGDGSVGSTETSHFVGLPSGTTVKYQWYHGSTVISGATKSTHKFAATDLGKVVTLRVKLSKDGYTSASLTSSDSVTVELGDIELNPTITGTTTVGKTLTAHSGSSVAGSTTFYTWYLVGGENDGTAVQSSTSSTYKIPASAKGKQLGVEVIVFATGYSPNEGESDLTKVIN